MVAKGLAHPVGAVLRIEAIQGSDEEPIFSGPDKIAFALFGYIAIKVRYARKQGHSNKSMLQAIFIQVVYLKLLDTSTAQYVIVIIQSLVTVFFECIHTT